MQEKQVTIGTETFNLDEPFLVMATQNPIEQEGTYSLPEAQIDRFLFKTVISYPTESEEIDIMHLVEQEASHEETIKSKLTKNDIIEIQKIIPNIYIDESLKEYIRDLVFATRNPSKYITDKDFVEYIAYGASPRASIGLMTASKAHAFLEGRSYVIPEDIKNVIYEVLQHRIIPSYEAEAENITSIDIINKIINSIKVP